VPLAWVKQQQAFVFGDVSQAIPSPAIFKEYRFCVQLAYKFVFKNVHQFTFDFGFS
jgi:hypothetical protein